ncbi:uncharacterized protein BO80DRAFT_404316 [Aspergillus ibericus CBS 121593]|uniref:TM7S3/TM198-like domain-containing protein n=1 Tax=Aspergillus ibericus CBS 121593 TaxID=1448316 RepID=A0A395H2Z5_9EURO|nr:hypothetical protein BO80DRAFT_404316 [Aspergillus ibericus CBS 121593]RAL02126.1 hypothetical protein BO80DRAFT_404316 [Aspergillus ibericus CBS 121593]
MRLLPVLALAACLVPRCFVSAEISLPERHELGGLVVREATPSTTTATETFSDTAASNSTNPDALPIQPTVTPALGIGGFLLLVTGAVLALIGIRNLRVQVFLSTAFLTGLGVTVLIVYVMSPPVRVAVQGAYLVAIFFTGMTFGALAIVFKELTEGLGCLLGGFCSSMWLLSLKPGGLLTDTNSKSGFIGAISVAFYAMSFSHHTRPYGLIVSTGISGGTAVALGIDCFSRAGLKEFWLYIWGLNDNIFPLGTNTYPITRNIRVELATTVIIAILGVVSQLRLWKVVRERRRREKEKRDDEQRQKEQSEAELGRRLEEDNIQERKEWEAKYGDAKPASGESESADDTKCHADEVDAMEKGAGYDMKSIVNSSDCSYRCSDCRERETEDAVSDATGAREGAHDREQTETAKETSDKIQEESGSLPIKVFDGAAAAQIKDDKSSDMTAVIGSDTATIRSKRASGAFCMPRGSRGNGVPPSQSREVLGSVDDGTSSVHGTIDEGGNPDSKCLEVQGENLEMTKENPESDEKHSMADAERQQPGQGSHDKQTPVVNNVDKAIIPKDNEGQSMAASTKKPEKDDAKEGLHTHSHSQASEVALIEANHGTAGQDPDVVAGEGKTEGLSSPSDEPPVEPKDEEGRLSTHVSNNGDTEKSEPKDHDRDQLQTGNPGKPDTTPDVQDRRPRGEPSPSHASSQNEIGKKREDSRGKRKSPEPQPRIEQEPVKEEPPKLNEETVKDLPRRTSRVVQSYRTNEWAKHLADAEAPELEPIKPIEEEQPECPPEVEEAAVPVNVLELLQTPLNAQPPPAVEPRVRDPPSRRNSRRISSGSQLHPYSHTDQSKKKSSQSPPPTAQPRFSNGYSMSGLIGNATTLEQPQEDTEATKPQWKGPAPLIAVREDMMRNRLSSFSLSMDPFARNNPGHPPPEGLRRSSTCRIRDEADDMPLSQRRAMLYQQTVPSPSPLPAHTPYSTSRRNLGNGPSPTNTPAAMAAWRESVQEDLKEKRNPLAKQNSSMVSTGHERNPPAYSQAQRHSIHIGNAIAEGMQRGDMSDLHREAMRRMQAKANKNVKEA